MLHIDEQVVRLLREQLPQVAAHTVAAVTAEVPGYSGALSGAMGENIGAAVQMALAGFLKLAAGARDADPSTPLGPTLEGAYDLGRGEARDGRSMDALLAAYRVGARVAWRELAGLAAQAGVDAATMAQFAELVFAYIDELSAASVAGHTDELSTSGRVRERYRERLGQHLLARAGQDVLEAAAERAGWTPPTTLTAVLVPSAQVRGVLASLGPDTLVVGEELPDAERRRRPAAHAAPGPGRGQGPPTAPDPGARRPTGGARAASPVVAGPLVVRPGRSHRGAGRRRPDPRRAGGQRGPSRPADRAGGPRSPRRPAGAGTRADERAAAGHPRAPRGDAAVLAAAPGPPGRGRRRAARARPDRALPDGPASPALWRQLDDPATVLDLLLALSDRGSRERALGGG